MEKDVSVNCRVKVTCFLSFFQPCWLNHAHSGMFTTDIDTHGRLKQSLILTRFYKDLRMELWDLNCIVFHL